MIITDKKEAAGRWREIKGDNSFRVNFDLDHDSMVFDAGGYKGKWTGKIFSRYGCTIHVFEPVLEFANEIEQKFAGIEKVHIHRFGLAHANSTRPISVGTRRFGGNSSSFYRKMDELRDASEMRAADFIRENRIKTIDLMGVNIEGGEYDLLDHLIESEMISRIRNIQIQFHDFFPNAERRMVKIQKGLERTHDLVFQFRFMWEGWRIKDR